MSNQFSAVPPFAGGAARSNQLFIRLSATSLFLFLFFSLWALPVAEADTITEDIGHSTVDLVHVAYDDPATGQSTWFYTVVSGGPPAVSHVTFGICADAVLIEAGSWAAPDFDDRTPGDGSPQNIITLDPTTGVVGLKFDGGFEIGETRHYYFSLNENYAIGVVDMGVKAGSNDWVGQVSGASCDPTAVTLQTFLAANPAAQQAALPMVILALMAVLLSVSFMAIKQ